MHLLKTKYQGGFALFPVAVALIVVASVVLLINYQGATGVNRVASDIEASQAQYIVQAGMQHALWQARNSNCAGDFTIPNTTIGSDSYIASSTGGGTSTAHTLSVDQDAWIRSDDITRNNGATADLHIRYESGKIEQPLVRFDLSALPANAQINSATLWLYIETGKEHPEGHITLHSITTDWIESDVTWDSFNGGFDSTPIGMITVQDTGGVWVQVNLTAQVQAWVNGLPNYGILLNSVAEGIHAEYISSEGNATQRPRLEVVVATGAVSPLSIQATGTLNTGVTRTLNRPVTAAYQTPLIHTYRPGPAESDDAEIWDQAPNNNYGDADATWVSSASNDTTRTLLRFSLDAIPIGAKILEATLFLERQSGTGADQPVTAHRIKNQWSENSVTWNQREPGTNWDTAGSDFDNVAIATTPIGPVNQHYEWNITPLVQGWVDGSYPNYGVVLVAGIPGMLGHQFYTSDQSVLDRRPSLIVKYACECNSACLAPKGTGNVLLVRNRNNPMSIDAENQARFESWGYTVTPIDDWDSQAQFDAAMASNDVVFISGASPFAVGTKLINAPIGVVNSRSELNDELGIASANAYPIGSSINVVDNSHFITYPFSSGALDIFTEHMEGLTVSGTVAPGIQTLADISSVGSLVVLDEGMQTTSGGTAAGRRVMLPLGRITNSNFNWDYINNEGLLLVQRALQWASGNLSSPTVNLLMVVVDPSNLTTQEAAKKSLLESWDYTVNLIDESDNQSAFDDAVAINDVVFITEDVSSGAVSNKLVSATIGVVTEEDNLSDEFGMSAGIAWESATHINIDDNTHYITQPFSLGSLQVMTSSESVARLTTPLSPELIQLGSVSSEPMLVALETGATTYLGGINLGRRVQLPWGGNDMDVNLLTANGLTIFQRALEWGAGAGPEANTIILATEGSATLGGLDFTDKDLAEYNPFTDTATLFLDGSELGLAQDPDAVHVLSNGNIILSAVNTITLGGINAENEDLIEYDPVADTATMFFDGSTLFSGGSTDVSAVYVLPDGQLLLTNEYSVTLGGLSFENNDIVQYDPINDTATMFLDGDTVGLTQWINAIHLLENGNLVLSIDGSGTLGGLNFEEGDLVEYDIDSDSATLYFDHNLFSGNENIRAAYITGNSGEVVNTSPIAHWKLDDGVGTMAIDSEGGHDGTLSPGGPLWVTGQIGGALDFDGINDYVDVGSFDVSGSGLTMMGWFNAEVIATDDPRIVSKANGTNEGDAWWQLSTSNSGSNRYLRMRIKAGGTTTTFADSSVNLLANQWYFAVGTYDNETGDMKLYLDGVEVASGSHALGGALDTNPSIPVAIGANGTTERFFNGILDDVRVYNRALTAMEISDLFAAGGGGSGCDGTFRDEFNARTWSGSDGTLSWTGDWIEIGESDGPSSGDIEVEDDINNYQLQTRDNNNGGEGVEREADLSAVTNATLSYVYRRQSLDNANDYTAVEVSANGSAGPWTELVRHQGSGTDSSYQSASHNISSFISNNTRIRFKTSSSMGGSDYVWFDDIEIAVSGCAN